MPPEQNSTGSVSDSQKSVGPNPTPANPSSGASEPNWANSTTTSATIASPSVGPTPSTVQSATNIPPAMTTAVGTPPKKSKKKLIIILAVVVLLVVIGIVAYVMTRPKPTSTTQSGTQQSTPAQTYTDNSNTPPPAKSSAASSSTILTTTAAGGEIKDGNSVGIPSATTLDEAVLKSIGQAEKSNNPAKLISKTFVTGTETNITEDWVAEVNGKQVTYAVTISSGGTNTNYTIKKKA